MKEGIPLVVLVGGPATGKTRFFKELTNVYAEWPTRRISPMILVESKPNFFIIDTPGFWVDRNKFTYSWQGIFQHADVILDFGNWLDTEIYGDKPSTSAKYMTWSGDNQETFKRIQQYLQGRK